MLLTCTKCGQEKEHTFFYKRSRNKSGYNSHCKTCSDSYDTSLNSRRTSKRYYEKYKSKSFAKSAKYRASKLEATPRWLSDAQYREIEEIYEECRKLENCHVDHIIPLKGENVCGLHVPWNLQILPAYDNYSKGNKYDQYK